MTPTEPVAHDRSPNRNMADQMRMGLEFKFWGDRHSILVQPPSNDVPAEPRGYRLTWFDRFCLWYPPGWLILFNRHWQWYQPDPDGWSWLEYPLFLIPGGFYLAIALRWLRLGGRSPRPTTQSVNPGYQQAFRQEILMPIVQRHFRGELHHLDQLPQSGPLIVVMNHAGMCFPWDMISLGALLSQHRGWLAKPVAHPLFFDHPWLHWWLPAGWAQALGCVPAKPTQVEQAVQTLTHNQVILYAPEAWRGLAKGWNHRYQLETFDPTAIRLSDRYHIPILPVACVGNEGINPWAFNLRRVAQWVKLPIFPISPLMLAFVFFPSMGVWGWPKQLRYYLQPPEAIGQGNSTTLKRSHAYQKAQELRSRLQEVIQAIAQPVPPTPASK